LNERIKAAVYSLDLRDEEVVATLEARKHSLEAWTVSDVDFIQTEMSRFLEQNPGSRAAFKVDESRMKLYLELPALSHRGLRPQDIIGAVIGLENASVRLTRERLVFWPETDRPSLLAAD